jgi:mevalonate pyrophosphate decarboxylase
MSVHQDINTSYPKSSPSSSSAAAAAAAAAAVLLLLKNRLPIGVSSTLI